MRESQHLRDRYRAVLSHVGSIMVVIGVVTLVPLATALAWPMTARGVLAFAVPGVALAAAGAAMRLGLARRDVVLTFPEGGVIVCSGWFVACVAGAVPLVVAGGLDLSEAMFESVSGWTTTGLSVIDVTRAEPAILLWRSTMQVAGGAGFAIIVLSAITSPSGASLTTAEGRADQLVPNVRSSARLVLRIYSGYVIAGVLALRLAGMGWFDAVNHAFSALSTGGFSTRSDSIGHWDSPGIELVVLVMMLLGNLSFVTAWCMLRGRLRTVAKNGEVRVVAVLIPASVVLMLALTCAPLYESWTKACRVAVFETVSALTTTGFSTVGYGEWNAFGVLLLVVLMLVGAGSCSTGGAIKQFRVHLLWRSLLRELRRPLLPRTAVCDDTVWVGEARVTVTDGQVRLVGTFAFLYLVAWLSGSAVLAANGCSFEDALFEFASTLGTVGLSVGVTGPDTSAPVLWTQIGGMLLGRLEFFVLLAAAAKVARDSRQMILRR